MKNIKTILTLLISFTIISTLLLTINNYSLIIFIGFILTAINVFILDTKERITIVGGIFLLLAFNMFIFSLILETDTDILSEYEKTEIIDVVKTDNFILFITNADKEFKSKNIEVYNFYNDTSEYEYYIKKEYNFTKIFLHENLVIVKDKNKQVKL